MIVREVNQMNLNELKYRTLEEREYQPAPTIKITPDEYCEIFDILFAGGEPILNRFGEELVLDKKLTKGLREEGFVRELIRFVQAARKKAGLNVDDRIKLSVSAKVPAKHLEMLKNAFVQ